MKTATARAIGIATITDDRSAPVPARARGGAVRFDALLARARHEDDDRAHARATLGTPQRPREPLPAHDPLRTQAPSDPRDPSRERDPAAAREPSRPDHAERRAHAAHGDDAGPRDADDPDETRGRRRDDDPEGPRTRGHRHERRDDADHDVTTRARDDDDDDDRCTELAPGSSPTRRDDDESDRDRDRSDAASAPLTPPPSTTPTDPAAPPTAMLGIAEPTGAPAVGDAPQEPVAVGTRDGPTEGAMATTASENAGATAADDGPRTASTADAGAGSDAAPLHGAAAANEPSTAPDGAPPPGGAPPPEAGTDALPERVTSGPGDLAVVPIDAAPPGGPALATSEAPTPADDTGVLRLDRAEDLAEAIDKLRPLPKGGATITVETPSLGRVALRVALEDGALRIRVVADDPAALEWFRGEHEGLSAAARQAVPNASHVELELQTRGEAPPQQHDRHDAGPHGGDPHGRAAAEARAPAEPGSPTPRATVAMAPERSDVRRGGALVDVVA